MEAKVEQSLRDVISDDSLKEALGKWGGKSFSESDAQKISDAFNPFEILSNPIEKIRTIVSGLDPKTQDVLKKHLKTMEDLNANNGHIVPNVKKKISKSR